MDAVLDTQKFVENLRRLFALPTDVMHYAIIDTDRFCAIADHLYGKVIVTKYVTQRVREPFKPGIISPLTTFTCPLQEAASNYNKTIGSIVTALNTVLRQIPFIITLPPDDHELLTHIDCTAITDENQLPELKIPLIAIHRGTKWQSAIDPIPLGALYLQTSLNELWTESKAGGGFQFREWF